MPPVTQFPPMEFSQPRVYPLTAVSKDLVRRPTRISYDLSLAHLIGTNWGCLFSRLRHDPPGKFNSTSCGNALVCSYYVRCVSTPEILFWRDVSVKS